MKRDLSRLLLLPASVCVAVFSIAPEATAVSTRSFVLDEVETLSAGELKGTAVSSNGVVTASAATRRHALSGVASAYCMARAADKSVFIGTGNNGKIYRLRGEELKLFAETGQLLVTSLVFDSSGTLYAGTLPRGKVFAFDKGGKARELPKLAGVEHVWSLVFDPKRKLLFAATGPQGKVFAIDPRGNAELYYDSNSAHVMALALDRDGTLYAGTSDRALVLRLLGSGRAQVVQNLPGTEVTALAVRDGQIAAVANDFPKGSASTASSVSVPVQPSQQPSPTQPPKTPTPSESSAGTSSTPSKASNSGTGQLWFVGKDGRAELLFKAEKSHLTAVQWADTNTLFAAAGRDGRVYRVNLDRSYAIWIDVDERMVLTIDMVGDRPLLTTGDTAAVYDVLAARGNQAIWTSKVLDAQYLARWGKLFWRAQGSISFQTRSGDADRPDAAWSEWSEPKTEPGPIRSPAARFLQVRAQFSPDAAAVLYAVVAYYLPLNQRMTIRAISVKARTRPAAKTTAAATCTKGAEKKPDPQPTGVYELTWKVDNPDGDQLRYRLQYRAEKQSLWRPMLRQNEILLEEKYEWDTSGVPDGYYRVRIGASDELANPKDKTLYASAESNPILVDNHPPEVGHLQFSHRTLQGIARDNPGPIASLEYAVDGGEWTLFFPKDELLDSPEESFALTLTELSPGSHIVAVRAADSAGNTNSAEMTVIVPGTVEGKKP
jgi:hypothetical protein